ncbi:hypothetical protein M3Y98_00680700 [Aphelenchoides besseyi]|nr:hypothetical protein M3Y98_00680700 [Aphelenchoides besseyi]KAI6209092.1 hypothetical protein M3Y96_00184300 [Aphelenchoides besseyi]
MSDNSKEGSAKPTIEPIAKTANKIFEFFPIRQYENAVARTQLTAENSTAAVSSESVPVVIITYASTTGSYKLTFR